MTGRRGWQVRLADWEGGWLVKGGLKGAVMMQSVDWRPLPGGVQM